MRTCQQTSAHFPSLHLGKDVCWKTTPRRTGRWNTNAGRRRWWWRGWPNTSRPTSAWARVGSIETRSVSHRIPCLSHNPPPSFAPHVVTKIAPTLLISTSTWPPEKVRGKKKKDARKTQIPIHFLHFFYTFSHIFRTFQYTFSTLSSLSSFLHFPLQNCFRMFFRTPPILIFRNLFLYCDQDETYWHYTFYTIVW